MDKASFSIFINLLINLSKGKNKMANINYNMKVASQLGSLLGMNLIRIERKNADPEYSNKEREGKQRLANPIWMHAVKRIRIKKAVLVNVGEGKEVVQFNDDPLLQLELANAKDIADIVKKPTVEEIVNAIASESAGVPAFFADDQAATELVCSFNERERKSVSSMMEYLSRMASNLQDANRIMQDACKLEMSQLGKDVDFKPVSIGE